MPPQLICITKGLTMKCSIDNVRSSAACRDVFNDLNVATYPDGGVVIDQEVLDEAINEDNIADSVLEELLEFQKLMNSEALVYLILHK